MMRLGMFYLAGYLLWVGYLLMFIPQMTMNLLLTNYTYDDLGSIGMIVVSMIVMSVPMPVIVVPMRCC